MKLRVSYLSKSIKAPLILSSALHLGLPNYNLSSQRYSSFDVVVGLAWSSDTESYGGSSIATGKAFRARQVTSDDPDEKGYPDLAGWRLIMRLATTPHKK
jgi:hypothetical protein